MADQKHTYPDRHGPGTHWATDEAWEILDTLRPGVLDEIERALIAGRIAGALVRVRAAGMRVGSLLPAIGSQEPEVIHDGPSCGRRGGNCECTSIEECFYEPISPSGRDMSPAERSELIASIAEKIQAEDAEHSDGDRPLDHNNDGW